MMPNIILQVQDMYRIKYLLIIFYLHERYHIHLLLSKSNILNDYVIVKELF